MFFLRPLCFILGHPNTIRNPKHKAGNGEKYYICMTCGKHTDSKY